MSVTLTEKAASEVMKIITDQKLEDGANLRVGVAGGGRATGKGADRKSPGAGCNGGNGMPGMGC